MDIRRVTADAEIMAGAPTIRGTRVTVSAILAQLAAGATVDELLEDYPSLEREDVYAALAFAAEAMPLERLAVTSTEMNGAAV
jgi:uncharacterized protein (DUF433 family)